MGIAGASFPYRDAGVARLLSRKIASYIVYASRVTLCYIFRISQFYVAFHLSIMNRSVINLKFTKFKMDVSRARDRTHARRTTLGIKFGNTQYFLQYSI